MGKLLRLGVLAGIVAGAVYAWKRLTQQEDDIYGAPPTPAQSPKPGDQNQ